MTTSAANQWFPGRRTIVAFTVLVALVVIYTLSGFVVAPWFAKRELPRIVAERLGHTLTIQELSFNPFTLTLRVTNVALTDKSAQPVAGFADALVDLDWRSLVRRAWVFSEARITSPSMNIVIDKQGRPNLGVLLPQGDGDAEHQLPGLAIDHLVIENGRVAFEDLREDYRTRFEHLSLDLKALSTLPNERGAYTLVGQTMHGAKLRWKGEFELNPVIASGTVWLENLSLPELNPYLSNHIAAKIVTGRADLELPYRYAPAEAKSGQPNSAAFTVTGAALGLHGLALQASDAQSPFAKVSRISLSGLNADLQKQLVQAQSLFIADLSLIAKRDVHGNLDLGGLGMLAQGAKPSEARETADSRRRWHAQIDSIDLSDGSVEYSDATTRTPMTLKAHGLDAKLKLNVASDNHGISVRMSSGELSLAQASVGEARKEPTLEATNIRIDGARFDSGESTLDVERVHLGRLALATALTHGRLSALDLLPTATVPNRTSTKTDTESASVRPLLVRAKSVQLADGGIKFHDLDSGIALALEHMRANLTGLTSDTTKQVEFKFAADIPGGGRIAADGHAVPGTGALTARISASAVALAPIKPMLTKYTNAQLTSGVVALAGTLKTSAKGNVPKLSYAGSASIANVAFDDQSGTRLIGWKSLSTDSLRFTLSPDHAEIAEMRWTAPAGRLAIAADGTTNIGRALVSAPAEQATPEPVKAQTDSSSKRESQQTVSGETAKPDEGEQDEAATEDTFPITIRRLYVTQGRLEFSDAGVSPDFKAKIYDLAGTANGIASNRSTRSNFALEGRVDEFGFAQISGILNPFQLTSRSNFRVRLRNLDVTDASPYAMKFAGYKIASGRMNLDLNYRINNGALIGDNKITLDKFSLGERVDSPSALNLPIELAVALLKDTNGRIDVAIPVSGNLADPKFKYGALIGRAIRNLLTSIVTAPFRALARLFGGGGEDLGVIRFDSGSARLLPPEQEKLLHIAEAMAKRPQLKLVIPARYDSEADTQALKRKLLTRELGRRAGFTLGSDEEPGPISIDDKRTRAAIRALYAERFSAAELSRERAAAEAAAAKTGTATEKSQRTGDGQPPLTIVDRVRRVASGEPQIADATNFYRALYRRLRDNQPLPENALADLAKHRAAAIESALEANGVNGERIVISNASPSADADAKEVALNLTLAAQ